MLLQCLIFILLAIPQQIFGQKCVPESGEFKPEDWANNPTQPIPGGPGCSDSYFKIDLMKNPNSEIFQILGDVDLDYKLNITDSSRPEKSLVYLENEIIDQDIFLASLSNDVTIEVTGSNNNPTVAALNTMNFPYTIKYQEVPKMFLNDCNGETECNANNTIEYEDIEPNSFAEYTMNGYGEVQLFDLSWDMKNNLGYVALENGNGRITIMSMPYMSNFKVALKKPESEKIKWKVISDKRPNEKPVGESKFRLDYILGPSEPITTTMKPNITTPRPLNGEVRIYILAINEQNFFKNHFTQLYGEISNLTQNSPNGKSCKITRTNVVSCRLDCAMTSNPDRGCLAFEVALEKSILCDYNITTFKSDLQDNLKVWGNRYEAGRIDLDDCLSSVEYQWIMFAVFIPVGSMAFVITAYFLVKSWIAKVRKMRLEKRFELEEERNRLNRLSTGGGRNKNRMTRTISQFEIMEAEE